MKNQVAGRIYHSAVIVQERLIIYGGIQTKTNTYVSSIQEFHIENHHWKTAEVTNDPDLEDDEYGLAQHAMVAVFEKAQIYHQFKMKVC